MAARSSSLGCGVISNSIPLQNTVPAKLMSLAIEADLGNE